MDYSADNNWDTMRKKYILSLRNRSHNNTNNISELNINNMDNNELFNKKLQSRISESGESQNFSLRLSDNSFVNDTIDDIQSNNVNDNNRETEIIIISDSSDDDDCLNNIQSNRNNVELLSTKISDSKLSLTCRNNDKKNSHVINENISIDLTNNDMNQCSLLTSDDSNIYINNNNNAKNNISNINSTERSNSLISSSDKENSNNIQTKLRQNTGKIIPINSSNSKTTKDVNKHDLYETPDSTKCTTRITPLTKKNARDIARVINSKRIVYDSPGIWQRRKEIIHSDSESSENTTISQEINNDKNKIKHPAWINETESDSSDTAQDNKQNLTKPFKTHVNRFLNPTIIDDTSPTLSDNKKEEISRWLLSNPIDSTSDTSVSYVPPSEQNSISSGNSSLERLELKYETPNNRDKFNSKSYIDNNYKSKITPTSTKQIQSAKVRQTTMDSFLRKVKRGDKNILYYTPIPITKGKKIISPSPPAGESSNLQIADCADILDKLYGNSWRDKANDLLPITEPRKANGKLKDRAIQTECEKNIKPLRRSASLKSDNTSNDNDFNSFVRNIKPDFNSTKKSTIKNKQHRDSFINDSLSSDHSDGETTYLTALTTPRISNSRHLTKKETPMSALTMRAIEICDTDTENDDTDTDTRTRTKTIIQNRRRLSFSDDEIDNKSSPGTSEYDPDDVIPPKSVSKSTKATALKSTIKMTTFPRCGTIKSFLASLSTSVSLDNCHADAKKYRMNYKTTKDDLCKYLYKLYNEKIFDNKLPDDMQIEWNVRMRGTAGFCYNKSKKKTLGTTERSSRIVLATKILDAPDRLRDTLVHEMCHAATWLINEVSDGHGPFWQAWASKAMKAFPELPSIKRCHDYKIATKYTYRCVSCGYSIGRHSKSLDIERKRCGHCHGKFELLINKITKTGTVQVKTPSNRKPSGFALFVKENYHSVKKERRQVGHKEVMQILGQQFSAIKISNNKNNIEN